MDGWWCHGSGSPPNLHLSRWHHCALMVTDTEEGLLIAHVHANDLFELLLVVVQ